MAVKPVKKVNGISRYFSKSSLYQAIWVRLKRILVRITLIKSLSFIDRGIVTEVDQSQQPAGMEKLEQSDLLHPVLTVCVSSAQIRFVAWIWM